MLNRPLVVTTSAAALVIALAGCAGASGSSASASPAVDGTFKMAIGADPGSLNPVVSSNTPTHQLARLTYDFLTYTDPETGKVGPWLAEKWDEKPDSVSYTIRDGVTCSDGTPLTAQTVADQIAFVTDKANKSALRDVYVPGDATATVDGSTVTIATPEPSPFLLLNTSRMPIMCEAGLKDPSLAEKGSVGSGLYEVTDVVPNDHYTLTRRDGYAWGPDDTTSKTAGVPKTVVVSIVSNESTAANQLISGELNAASVKGADQDRLDSAKLDSAKGTTLAGEMFFNHADTNATADPAVRRALVEAVDLDALAKVITGGRGARAEAMEVASPRACTYDAVKGHVADFDAKAAGKALDEAGWTKGADGTRSKDGKPLALNFFYQSLGDTYDAAADVAQKAWSDLGAKVTVTSGDANKAMDVLLSGTDNSAWDIAWEPIHVNVPSMLVPFLSGPAPADGMNLASIANSDYEAKAKKAASLVGDDACDAWADADSALVEGSDVIPFAVTPAKTFFAHAGLSFGNALVGPALRLFQ